MPAVHRNNDSRSCGATTTVTGQSTVIVGGELISVDGDPNSHGGGNLTPNVGEGTVIVEGQMVIVVGCTASPDSMCPELGGEHCSPSATSGSNDVIIY